LPRIKFSPAKAGKMSPSEMVGFFVCA